MPFAPGEKEQKAVLTLSLECEAEVAVRVRNEHGVVGAQVLASRAQALAEEVVRQPDVVSQQEVIGQVVVVLVHSLKVA